MPTLAKFDPNAMPISVLLDRPNLFAPSKVRDEANKMFSAGGYAIRDNDGKPAVVITGDHQSGLTLYAADSDAALRAIETLELRFGTKVEKQLAGPRLNLA